ncbi:conserved hypothetical protein [Xanthomonas phaseoli pv. phaseoli]|nr:conserved hypothetical protein [Xanthomonas phaseoli pv. phaseoli]
MRASTCDVENESRAHLSHAPRRCSDLAKPGGASSCTDGMNAADAWHFSPITLAFRLAARPCGASPEPSQQHAAIRASVQRAVAAAALSPMRPDRAGTLSPPPRRYTDPAHCPGRRRSPAGSARLTPRRCSRSCRAR